MPHPLWNLRVWGALKGPLHMKGSGGERARVCKQGSSAFLPLHADLPHTALFKESLPLLKKSAIILLWLSSHYMHTEGRVNQEEEYVCCFGAVPHPTLRAGLLALGTYVPSCLHALHALQCLCPQQLWLHCHRIL